MGFLPSSQYNVEHLLIKIAELLEKLEAQSIQGGYFLPVSSTDAAAPNNSIYYSTTQTKLVYKDSGGVVHNLY
jgi:hypothetical protein